MKKISSKIIYSPSDLSNFIHCKHLTSLDKEALYGKREKPTYTNKVMLALREKGLQFEASFLESLREEEKTVCIIESKDPEAHQKTVKAIQNGCDVI